MTFAGRMTSTRPAKPSHQEWVPLPYMQEAVDHLVARHSGGLALDPGLRKTSITLAAYLERVRLGTARTMLVIAPLRICRRVWRQEGAKWSQFRHLKFALLHGDKKDHVLATADADIYLINPEGVDWLCKKFFGRSLPFDIVTIDELTKFKNSQADRHKSLRPRLKGVRTRWGLTGSLTPNGYMDLFGQMLILDDGAALGRYITHYRDTYFSLGFNGFDYELQPGAEGRIIKKIAPYWLQMSADDYLDLPPLVEDIIEIELDAKAAKLYAKMKRDMIATLPEGVITAANSAACYSKLSQMANGAVYVGDNKEAVAVVHDAKLDALEDLVEELSGRTIAEINKNPTNLVPLLVAYEFNHDIERLRERFGVTDPTTGKKVVPYLGKGTTAAQEELWMRLWNENKLPWLFCHPASAGHGLNLQEGSAGHVCWFSPTWDLELWDQFIRRLRRSGNQAQRIMNHILVVKGTIDELKMEALDDKDTSQVRLLKALNTEIRRNAEALTAGGAAGLSRRNNDMVAKLSRPGTPAADAAPAANERPRPAAWGKTGNASATDAPQDQRQEIAEKLNPEANAAPAGRAAFGRRVAEVADEHAKGTEDQGNDAHSNGVRTDAPDEPAAPATRARRGAAKQVPEAIDASSDPRAAAAEVLAKVESLVERLSNALDTNGSRQIAARASVFVAVAGSDPSLTVEEITEISEALWSEIVKPF